MVVGRVSGFLVTHVSGQDVCLDDQVHCGGTWDIHLCEHLVHLFILEDFISLSHCGGAIEGVKGVLYGVLWYIDAQGQR